MFDINRFRLVDIANNRYEKQLNRLKDEGIDPYCIESAVGGAIQNLSAAETRSFVIYGEPQSGKTEMMIALTARLLDHGHKIVVHLLNDSLQLLEQNLDRFQRSGIDPSPCNYTDILDPVVEIGQKEWIIFCKKNARDLEKLSDKLAAVDGVIVVDDEADYASPNAKVNSGGDKTRINFLIETLLKDRGTYIGVTATPARLDLNNTFENDHEKWIDFPAHKNYTGQDTFFPISNPYNFRISWIPSGAGDEPKWCREALLRFLVNVAFLNLNPGVHGGPKNYSFLVHTSGKKADHKKDYQQIQKVFGVLSDQNHPDFEGYVEKVWSIAEERYRGSEDEITLYVRRNIGSRNIVVMNSERDASKNYKSATDPSAVYTVVIGGNIVSRGVTFNNLLSMYFTRDVKHKIQQDTYIQRARMFGSRGGYLKYFELTIPEALYLDWHRCFIFHRLSLEAIRSGQGAPVWLSDDRISAVSISSIDKSNVSLDQGEMSFGMFDFAAKRESIDSIIDDVAMKSSEKLQALQLLLGGGSFPRFLLTYISKFSPNGEGSTLLHSSLLVEGQKGADVKNISRKRGFMGGAAFTKNPEVTHHLRVLYNAEGKARLFYKYSGKIKFLKNMKNHRELQDESNPDLTQ